MEQELGNTPRRTPLGKTGETGRVRRESARAGAWPQGDRDSGAFPASAGKRRGADASTGDGAGVRNGGGRVASQKSRREQLRPPRDSAAHGVRGGAAQNRFSLSAERAEELSFCLLFAALGVLFGALPLFFEAKPFAIALCAGLGAFLPAAAGGVVLGCLFTRDLPTLTVALAALVFRAGVHYLYRRKRGGTLFGEPPLWRTLSALLPALALGLWRLIDGQFCYYDLFALLLLSLCAPLSAFLYAGTTEEPGKERFAHSREAGAGALLLSCVFLLRGVTFWGIAPAAVLAAGLAFYLSARRGLLFGAAGASLLGLAFDPALSPAFLLLALGFSLLEKSSRGGGVLAGCGAGAAWAFFLRQTAGLSALLPSLLCAGALFLAGDSAGLFEGAPVRTLNFTRRKRAEYLCKSAKDAECEARLSELSGTLCELSGTFFEISSRLRRPGLSELRHLCDRAFDSTCPGCPERETCWGSDYAKTARTVETLGARLRQSGTVSAAQIPPELAGRCTRMPTILKIINEGALTLSDEALRGDKTAVVAADYAAAGRLLTEALSGANARFSPDPALGERISERLSRMGYTLESAAVCGETHRRVLISGLRLPGRHLKIRELRETLEKICRFPLGEAESRSAMGLYDLVFPEREALAGLTVRMTRTGTREGAKPGARAYCGDSVYAFQGDGFDYSLLCDGMGSGNAAALTSALSVNFLSRLIGAGVRADSALRMLNGFLSVRSRRENESSTTVDLLEIDRVTGEASLYKCGAAPSYLLRRGEVTRFAARTAPAGILPTLDAERIYFRVEPGDVLVQLSDGFTGNEEDCSFMAELLSTRFDGDAEAFARLALNKATGRSEDDLSIALTVVEAADAQSEKRERYA